MRILVKLYCLFILFLSGSNYVYSKSPAKAGSDSVALITQHVQTTQVIESAETKVQAEIALNKTDQNKNSDREEMPVISTSNQYDARSKLDDSATERINKSIFFKIGGILTVLGLIFGFMFGRTAFLISLAGVVFLAIGHFLI